MPLTRRLLTDYKRGELPSSRPPNNKPSLRCALEYLQYCCCHTTSCPPNVAIPVDFCFSGGPSVESLDSDSENERVRRSTVRDRVWLFEWMDAKTMGFGARLTTFRLFGWLD